MAHGLPAIRMVHFHRSGGEDVFRTTSLRTRAFVFRHIDYGRMVVDERLLTPVFPYLVSPSRHWCVLMLRGRLELQGPRPITASAGDCVLLGQRGKRDARWFSGECLELEWTPPGRRRPAEPVVLRGADVAVVRAVAAAVDDRQGDARHAIDLGLRLFRECGAPVPVALGKSRQGPTEDERLLGEAIEAQINDLKGRATTLGLSDGAQRSPRQLQRLLQRFTRTYGFNAGSWRDMRNRCRVQLAAIMLSLPERSIARIASEVGYASSNALSRAFASVGLPSPSVVRRASLAAAERGALGDVR